MLIINHIFKLFYMAKNYNYSNTHFAPFSVNSRLILKWKTNVTYKKGNKSYEFWGKWEKKAIAHISQTKYNNNVMSVIPSDRNIIACGGQIFNYASWMKLY